MGIVNNLLDMVAERIGKSVQGSQPSQATRDYREKGASYSVESEVSETLADLMLMFSSMPISGESERALWLDDLSDRFFRLHAKKAVSAAFLTGDCLVVPSWNGRTMQNIVVSSDDFEVLGTSGDEMTAVAYVVDTATKDDQEFQLLQAIELVDYTGNDGGKYSANRYRMYIGRNNSITSIPISEFPQWEGLYDSEWYIPNVERLLVGRCKSFAIDPVNLNSVKGVPICFGASDPIGEIHYLLRQMHDEFGFSEKMIMADKRMFQRQWRGGDLVTELPRGKDRLIMATSGNGSEMKMEEWAPDIRYKAYLEAIDKQERRVERAVGVSSGIISTPDDVNYQNVDNVRKSQQKTMSFVSTARRMAEECLTDLVYAWDVIASYHGLMPMGDYEVSFDWSNEYVETFADRMNAIVAGVPIGATDAMDYRQFVMDESPEAARERVEEIQAAQQPGEIEGVSINV